MKRIAAAFLIIAISLLSGLCGLAAANRGALMHAADRGFFTEQEVVSSVVRESAGSYTILFKENAVGFIHKLCFDISLSEERPPVLMVTAYDENAAALKTFTDKNPIYVGTEVIRLDLAAVSSVTVSADSDVSIGGISIDNRLVFDPYAFFFWAAAALAVCLITVFRKKLAARPELVFLTAIVSMGLMMVVSLPRNKVGYDEEAHLMAVTDIASLPSGELHLSSAVMNQMNVTEYNHPDAQPSSIEEMREFDEYLAAYGNYKTGERSPNFTTLFNRVPAYLPMSAAMKLGKGLSLSWGHIIMLSRLANLMTYALIMCIAIHFVPAGKYLMLVIGLMPENVFLASTFSYDPFITACLMAGTAFMLRLFMCSGDAAASGNDISDAVNAAGSGFSGKKAIPAARMRLSAMQADIILMFAFMMAGCMVKAVYAPVILMALAVPAEHFSSKKTYRIYIAAAIAAFAAMMAMFILPTVFAPSASGDARGAETVSEVSQVGFILGDPLRYAFILIRQMLRWIPQCFIGPDCSTFMGHIVNGSTGFRGYWQLVFILLITALAADTWLSAPAFKYGKGTEHKARSGNGRMQDTGSEGAGYARGASVRAEAVQEPVRRQLLRRLWIFLMIGAASVLIWTSMYVAFTEPGAEEIAGVQGRYFIPLMFPLYMLFSPFAQAGGRERMKKGSKLQNAEAKSLLRPQSGGETGASLERIRSLCYYLLMYAPFAVLAATVWQCITVRFCM